MDKKGILSSMKLFLFDMDGTLYLGDRLYDFTIELLQTIREKGGKYLFMTNNSSKSVADYIKKLEKMGIASTREDFITSSQATAYYLHKHHEGQTLYVCGTESLKEELRYEGFTVTEKLDKVECVVMGFDTELTFKKLHDVSYLLLTRPGFIALQLIGNKRFRIERRRTDQRFHQRYELDYRDRSRYGGCHWGKLPHLQGIGQEWYQCVYGVSGFF